MSDDAGKPTALDIVDSARRHQEMLDANKKAHLARLSRRDIRRAMGERGLELLDQHDEAIRQAHDRLSTLTKDFTQIATDLVDLGNTLRALIESTQHLSANLEEKVKMLRAGVNREVDDVRMQLGELDEHIRRVAFTLRDLDVRTTPPPTLTGRLRMLFTGGSHMPLKTVPGGPGATNADPRVSSPP